MLEMSLPQNPAQVGVHGKNIVRTPGYVRHLLKPAIRDDPAHNQRLEDRVHGLLLVLQLQLPQKLKTLHAFFVDGGLVFLPTAALGIAAVREPIRHAPHLCMSQRQADAHQTE
jgi:hypothetical protein